MRMRTLKTFLHILKCNVSRHPEINCCFSISSFCSRHLSCPWLAHLFHDFARGPPGLIKKRLSKIRIGSQVSRSPVTNIDKYVYASLRLTRNTVPIKSTYHLKQGQKAVDDVIKVHIWVYPSVFVWVLQACLFVWYDVCRDTFAF